jgi:5-methyltetrahydropteroyltriglutamate--homocysteine methyltransferase
MLPRAKPPFRADHVGSLLRPASVREARAKLGRGEIDPAALQAVEDDAIRDLAQYQADLGLRSVTDGECRRRFFHTDFLTQLEGVTEKGGLQVKFHTHTGELDFAPPVLQVGSQVRRTKPIMLRDFQYLKSVTKATPKVTIPSPTMLHFRGGRQGISAEAYPDLEAFYADVARAYAAELRELAEAGCTYVQLDDTNLAYLCDPKLREAARQRGHAPDELPRLYARFINMSIAARPANMTVCIHLCRGNFRSAWAAEGGYEPVAQVLFNELNVDGYFLEYDDERSGDFAPLRHVPKHKIVVLGLVSTKIGELESESSLIARIEAAAKLVPLEQLCLSPQCGFSSTEHGNDVAVEAQTAKLRRVVETARRVWGEA